MKKLLFLPVALVLFIVSCKKDDVFPSVEGTTWEVHLKWSSQPDTAILYTKFNAGGNGQEVTSGGAPTGTTFTWSQDDSKITWNYSSPDIEVTGNINNDGNYMSGTSSFGANTGGWRAVLH